MPAIAKRKVSPHYKHGDTPLLECPQCAGISNLAVHTRQLVYRYSDSFCKFVGYVRCNTCTELGPFVVHGLAEGAAAHAASAWNKDV